MYRVRKEAIENARASDDRAAEPELVEKGMTRRGARKARFVLESGPLGDCVCCAAVLDGGGGRGLLEVTSTLGSEGRSSANTARVLVLLA